MPLVTRGRKSPSLTRPAAGSRQSHEITVAVSASRKQQTAAATARHAPSTLARTAPALALLRAELRLVISFSDHACSCAAAITTQRETLAAARRSNYVANKSVRARPIAKIPSVPDRSLKNASLIFASLWNGWLR